MSDADGYNGWSNRATWAANLHLSNDQGLWITTLELVREARGEPATWSDGSYEVARALKAWVADELLDATYWTEQYGGAPADHVIMPEWAWSMRVDVGDPDDIDWQELAESLLGDLTDDVS